MEPARLALALPASPLGRVGALVVFEARALVGRLPVGVGFAGHLTARKHDEGGIVARVGVEVGGEAGLGGGGCRGGFQGGEEGEDDGELHFGWGLCKLCSLECVCDGLVYGGECSSAGGGGKGSDCEDGSLAGGFISANCSSLIGSLSSKVL